MHLCLLSAPGAPVVWAHCGSGRHGGPQEVVGGGWAAWGNTRASVAPASGPHVRPASCPSPRLQDLTPLPWDVLARSSRTSSSRISGNNRYEDGFLDLTELTHGWWGHTVRDAPCLLRARPCLPAPPTTNTKAVCPKGGPPAIETVFLAKVPPH